MIFQCILGGLITIGKYCSVLALPAKLKTTVKALFFMLFFPRAFENIHQQ